MALADARELEDVLSSKTVQLASATGKELPAISDENEDEKSDERRDLPKILRTTGRRYFFFSEKIDPGCHRLRMDHREPLSENDSRKELNGKALCS